MQNKPGLLITLFFLQVIIGHAQVNTRSPYSRYGLGEIRQPGFTSNLSMGSTGIALRIPNQINYINPASYTSLDTLSFIFDFGLNGSITRYYTSETETQLRNFNIDHIAISFPVTHWWKSGVGVTPFSSVGYDIKQQELDSELGLTDYYFEGSGGLSRFFIGNSFNPVKSLSLGFNLNYVFGFQNYSQTIQFPSDKYSSVIYEQNNLKIRGMAYNFGMQYLKTFSDKYYCILGLIFDPEIKLKAEKEMAVVDYFPGSQSLTADSVVIYPNYLVSSDTLEGKVVYPRKLGAGFSVGITKILSISADYTAQEWSKTTVIGRNDSLVNSNSFNFGMEYTPGGAKTGKTGYFGRIHYRLGGYYSNSYLRFRENQLKDYGISFGVGLPFRNTKTTFNLGFVYGQRGTLANDLIKEKYGIVSFSMSFHDFWFFKRVID